MVPEEWIDHRPIKKVEHIIKKEEQLRKAKTIEVKKEDPVENKTRIPITTNTILELCLRLKECQSLKTLKFLLYQQKIKERKTQT